MPAMPIPKPHTTIGSYADKMGINPIHFFGGHSRELFNVTSACDDVWHRHTWQLPDHISHEDLAYQLMNSERTLSEYLGYPVYPQWIELDMAYPAHHRGMYDSYGMYKTLATQVGYVHAGGVQAHTNVASDLPVVYSDEDGDGFKETATVDISGVYDAAWFDAYGTILVVSSGLDPEFAIDSYVSLDENSIVIRTWVLIKPEIASEFPKNEIQGIDLGVETNLVQTVDLYRVYNDPTGAVTFSWDSGDTQVGTIQVIDVAAGIVRPMPDLTTSWCTGYVPSRVKISVYAGHLTSKYWYSMGDSEHSKLDPMFAEAVRLLTTARLERNMCGCTNLIALGESLREDMALVSPQGNFLAVADVIQECPFGTRRGEWLAWNKLRSYQDKYHSVALV